jgi:hypothetical protein
MLLANPAPALVIVVREYRAASSTQRPAPVLRRLAPGLSCLPFMTRFLSVL